jgi:hypothetical protein
MDLRCFVRAVFSSAAGITRCLAVALLFCTVASQAATGRTGSDYLYPDEALGGRMEPDSRLLSGTSASKPLGQKTYRAFDGQSYVLQEYRGQFVSVLLPDRPETGPFFTAEHIEEMVFRLDALYSLYREILLLEPDGSGPLTVAFVPDTCGMGCGLLGAKGIEILADPLNYDLIIGQLDAGRLDAILVHEMAHNFDKLASHLHYLPDHAHAWTDFFQFFATYRYGRNMLAGEAPDDLFNSPVSAVWKDYIASDNAGWALCVRDAACEDQGLTANNAWAMLYYRIETLYGTGAILNSLEFLADYVTSKPMPVGAEAREELRILSLAYGTGANIACHLEPLDWHLSTQLASQLQREFGPPDPMCIDADADGFVAMTGDCDETDPARHALGIETDANGRDDDCDGLVDEQLLIESEFGSGRDAFTGPVHVNLPFEADGSAASGDDRDTFSFDLGASKRARVTLCSDGSFKGWAVALDDGGRFLEDAVYYAHQPRAGCANVTFDFSAQSRGAVMVMPDGSPGGYSLTVSEASDLPPEHASLLAALPRTSGGVRLQVDDSGGMLESLGADELELWVAGTAERLSLPWSPSAAVTLNRSTAPSLSNDSLYQLRMRPRKNGRPLLPFSAGHLFSYQADPAPLPQLDHRYSGAWFDPAHQGEGFIVEVLDSHRAVVYWFTYHKDGRQRWMTGVGAVEGGRIVVEDLIDTRGGRFGPGFDPEAVLLQAAGSLSISFNDCAEAVANYSVDNVGGSQLLRRLTHLHGHRCGGSESPPANDFSGSWYDPAHNGEGFVVQQLSASEAAVFWFTYDAGGGQAWFMNTGTIDGDRLIFPELLQPSGGRFGRSFDPATVRLESWGALDLRLDCAGGTAAYQPVAEGFSPGLQNLVNLTRPQNSGCGGM